MAQMGMVRSCRCFADGQFEQAVGIALEARRLDKLEQTIKSSPDMIKTLTYSLQVCQTLVISREFRQQVSLNLSSAVTPEHVLFTGQTDAQNCLEGKDCHRTHLAHAGKRFNYYY